MTKFWFKKLEHFASFSQKIVSTSSIKNLQENKKCYFQMPTVLVLELKAVQNRFLRSFLWSNDDLNSLWCFASLSQKMVSTSPPNNLQKTEKFSLQTFRTFVFELKVLSKPFSKKLPMTKFYFKQFLMFCLTFPEKSFNFVTQKFAKNWKIPFSDAQNICFWYQVRFKTVF